MLTFCIVTKNVATENLSIASEITSPFAFVGFDHTVRWSVAEGASARPMIQYFPDFQFCCNRNNGSSIEENKSTQQKLMEPKNLPAAAPIVVLVCLADWHFETNTASKNASRWVGMATVEHSLVLVCWS